MKTVLVVATSASRVTSGVTFSSLQHSPVTLQHRFYRTFKRTLAQVLILALIVPHPASIGLAHAQILVDKKAPAEQRPVVVADPAGRPVIQIQTPSAGGVSHNRYSRFDVDARGATFDNNPNSNPWLSKPAQLILNEVNGPISRLNGPLAVSGPPTSVVIANPNGIEVNGAGFINIPQLTLTTGKPEWGANGTLAGYRVEQGTVNLKGSMDARSVDKVNLYARAMRISGVLNAQAVHGVLGANQVTVDGVVLDRIVRDGKPVYALDAVHLGSMYAGRIFFVASENGAGVRNLGSMRATERLVVTADGKLVHQGSISAPVVQLATVDDAIEVSGTIQADELLRISSGGDLTITGKGLQQPVPQVSAAPIDPSASLPAPVDPNAPAVATTPAIATGPLIWLDAQGKFNLAANAAISSTAPGGGLGGVGVFGVFGMAFAAFRLRSPAAIKTARSLACREPPVTFNGAALS